MSAVVTRLRADLRQRWTSWVALALAIGVAGAVVLTAATGARRTGTAYQRFLGASRAEDVYLAYGQGDPGQDRYIDDVARLPQVAAAARVAAVTVYPPNGSFDTPYHFAGLDGAYGTAVTRPNVVAGRMPRPDRADEVLVNRALAHEKRVRVGDVLHWVALTTEQTEENISDPKEATPVSLRVVGIGVYPNEVVPTAQYDSLPYVYLSPAFTRAQPRFHMGYGFLLVRLKHGPADVAAFSTGVHRLLEEQGQEPSPLSARAERNAQVQRAIRPQAQALGLFALLAGAAFLLVIGQVLARRIFLDAEDHPTLRALGMSRRQLWTVAMVRVGMVALVGSAVAVVAAVLASPLMPIGPARLAEPHPGMAVNVVFLAAGFVAITLLLLGVASWPAWRAAAATEGVRGRRPSRLAEAVASAGLPPSSVIGVRSALDPGRGRAAVPVRNALIGTGLAIATVVAAFTFTTNLDDLVHSPRRYGWTWDFKAGNGFFGLDTDAVRAKLRARPDVEAVAGANYSDIRIGDRAVPTFGVGPIRGRIFPTLLEGRPPRNDTELVLGTRTLRRAHRKVGDRIDALVNDAPRRMRVVGRAVFPKLGAGSFAPTDLGDGAVTVASLFADTPEEPYTFLLIRLRPGADVAANQRGLQRDLGPLDFCGGNDKCVQRAERPGDINNYERVRTTPLVLGGVLVLFALGTLGHLLITSVRRRRRDLAVLKTLGFVRRQVSGTVAWQATTVAVAALLIGLPLGLAGGRLAWQFFAEQLGVGPEQVTPVLALVLTVPATVVLANLIAAAPALAAARTQPARILRSE